MNFDDILAAKRRLLPFLSPTPCPREEVVENTLDYHSPIYFKLETRQPVGSFKIRGALNALLQLSEEEKERGVITRSSGNFSSSLSYAAEQLNIPLTVVMPQNASAVKVEICKQHGARVVLASSYVECDAVVRRLSDEQGLTRLHPFDHEAVIAGQGTTALEILDSTPSIHHFFCPVGGGGLMGGASLAIKTLSPDIITWGIEPEGANDYTLSRLQGKKVQLNHIDTIADGLRTPTVGDKTFPLLNTYVDEVITVTDKEIIQAMQELYQLLGVTTEPSGAVSYAGFKKVHDEISGGVAILLSGKNVEEEFFNTVISSS